MKTLIFFSAFLALVSCKTGSNPDQQYDKKGKPVYKLQLNPESGSKYKYSTSNKTTVEIEADGKKIIKVTRSEAGLYYEFTKDSIGDFLIDVTYDQLHLYSKTGDVETDWDTNNGKSTLDPIEKMLGLLKGSIIKAVVSPRGELKSISGYDEIGDKFIQQLGNSSAEDKAVARKKWNEMIGDGMVKKNIEDIFRIFPDSSVYRGARWKLFSKNGGEIPMNISSYFTLKEVDDQTARIEMEGEIVSDSSAINPMAQSQAEIKGFISGEYIVDVKTGMLLTTNMAADIKGTINAFGKKIPLTIKSNIKMEGTKIR